ncbi:Uncharacterised protein [Serratia fonticola]|uniref:glycine-rich domain-containing protein n=1 Tax=Serratia fonticola TaxID=47917 RepID=UPI002178C27E|nr:hypothetical protein [Serratia fonticola]CAI1773314.1 Uncharacterised protein [Serratia fonticola]
MQSSSSPKKIPLPFASEGDKREIPIPINPIPGAASYTDGFPPLTRLALSAGGIPPSGFDFNGVLNDITSAIRWANAGMGYTYDSAFSTAVSGYPKGAKLTKLSLDGVWLNTIEGNVSNPDTGGSGWVDMTAGRLINVRTFVATSIYTPTPGTKYVVVEVVGGGGAGGGAAATGAGAVSVGSGGTAGSYGKGKYTSGFAGVTITVGAGGVENAGETGGSGGQSSFGTLLIAPGGTGGIRKGPSSPTFGITGSSSGGAVLGANIISAPGAPGGYSMAISLLGTVGGIGAASVFGGGGTLNVAGGNGGEGTAPGSGGAGAFQSENKITALTGGRGAAGIVIVWEYS